jgi:hypothetical protein
MFKVHLHEGLGVLLKAKENGEIERIKPNYYLTFITYINITDEVELPCLSVTVQFQNRGNFRIMAVSHNCEANTINGIDMSGI